MINLEEKDAVLPRYLTKPRDHAGDKCYDLGVNLSIAISIST